MVPIDPALQVWNNQETNKQREEGPQSQRQHHALPGGEGSVPGLVLVACLDDKDDYDKDCQAHQDRDQLHSAQSSISRAMHLRVEQ